MLSVVFKVHFKIVYILCNMSKYTIYAQELKKEIVLHILEIMKFLLCKMYVNLFVAYIPV